MPSPVAHSILSLALVTAFFLPRWHSPKQLIRGARRMFGWALLFVFLGNAPDLDYIPGLLQGKLNYFHHGPSHSLFWCLAFATAIWCFVKAYSRAGFKRWCLLASVVLLHIMADLLTQDRAAPYGIMVAWPFDTTYIQGPFELFLGMEKKTTSQIFTLQNAGPALREIAITSPFLLVALLSSWTRTPKTSA